VVTIGTDGELRQGTGALGVDYTGLRIWRDTSVGRIGGYNDDTLQWYADTDGKLYAGAGNARLDANGFAVVPSTDYAALRSFKFASADGASVYSGLYGYVDGSWNEIGILSTNLTGKGSKVLVQADAATGESALVTIEAIDTTNGSAILYVNPSYGVQAYLADSDQSFSVRYSGTTIFSIPVGAAASLAYGLNIGTISGGLNVGTATGAGTGGIKASGAVQFTGGYITGIGKSVSKSVPHNTATAIVDIAIGGVSAICAKYLVTFAGNSTNTNMADTWLVGQAYNATTCERVGSLVGFGMTSVTVTAAADTGNRKVRLTITQVNTSSETQTVRVNVVPVGVVGEATITVTGL